MGSRVGFPEVERTGSSDNPDPGVNRERAPRSPRTPSGQSVGIDLCDLPAGHILSIKAYLVFQSF